MKDDTSDKRLKMASAQDSGSVATLKSSSNLWTSAQNFKLYDESDFEKEKAVFDTEDIVVQELKLTKSSRKKTWNITGGREKH